MSSFSSLHFLMLVFALVANTITSFAQDTIHTVNKKKILAKVVEINYKDVLYKKFNQVTGPTYNIPRHELVKIVYANGVIDTFNVKLAKIPEPIFVPPPPPKFDPRAADYFQNFIYITVTDLFIGLISVGYERTFKSGKGSIKIPLSFGMSNLGITKTSYGNISPLSPALPSGAYYFSNKIFSTGIELNAFPKGQGTVKYFWGPAFEYGQYHYYTYKGVVESPGSFKIEKMTSPIFAMMLKNGVLIQPSKKFNLAIYFGLGTNNLAEKSGSKSSGNYYYSDGILNYVNFEIGINAGYKF